jgi:hypothetical protein
VIEQLTVALLAVAGFVVIVVLGRLGVSRRRLEQFALREGLPITAGNGNRVLAYLAVTRRWRSAGLTIAIAGLVYLQWWISHQGDGSTPPLPDQARLDLAAFAGWFTGAVIAEWRIDTLHRSGSSRAAPLQPRRLRDYLNGWWLAIPLVVWTALAVLEVVGLVRLLRGSVHQARAFVGVSLVALACGVVLIVVVRRIVGRPQPAVAEDVLAADNALRRHSLRVLFGAAIAFAGYFGFAIAIAVTQRLSENTTAHGLAAFVGLAVLPIIGLLYAVAPRRGLRAGQAAAVR